MTPRKMTIEDLAIIVKNGFVAVEARLDRIEARLDSLEARVASLEDCVSELEGEIQELRREVKELKEGKLVGDVDLIYLRRMVARLEKKLGVRS